MKSISLISIAAFALILVLQSCQEKDTSTKDTSIKNPSTTKIAKASTLGPSHFENCYIPFHELKDPGEGESQEVYQIKEACAINFINEYQAYTENLIDELDENPIPGYENSGTKLILGAEVDVKELRRVLESDRFKDEHNAKLYIMSGIIPKSVNPLVDSTELIFTLRSDSIVGNDTLYRWNYFDFTRPCPTLCPDLPVAESF